MHGRLVVACGALIVGAISILASRADAQRTAAPEPLVSMELRHGARFVHANWDRAPDAIDDRHAFDLGIRIESPSANSPRGSVARDIAPYGIRVARRVGERWYFELGAGEWFVGASFTAELTRLVLPVDDDVREAIGIDDERFVLWLVGGDVFVVDARGATRLWLPGLVTNVWDRSNGHLELCVQPGVLLDHDFRSNTTTILDVGAGIDLESLPKFRGMPRAFQGEPPRRFEPTGRGGGRLGDRAAVYPRGDERDYSARDAGFAFAFGVATGSIPDAWEPPSAEEGARTETRASHTLVAMPFLLPFSDGTLAVSARRVLRFGLDGRFIDSWGSGVGQFAAGESIASFAWTGGGCNGETVSHLCAVHAGELVPFWRNQRTMPRGESHETVAVLDGALVQFVRSDRSADTALIFDPIGDGETVRVALDDISLLQTSYRRSGRVPYETDNARVEHGVLSLRALVGGRLGFLRVGPGTAVEGVVPNHEVSKLALAGGGFGLAVESGTGLLLATRDGGRTFSEITPRRVADDAPLVCGTTRCAIGSTIVGPRSAMAPLARFRMISPPP